MVSDTQSTAVGRIIVGVDGSEPSKMALHWAAGLAGPLGAPIEAVMAWEPMTGPGRAYAPTDLDAEIAKVLSDTIDAVFGETHPSRLSAVVRRGSPAKVLIDLSAGAKLLVVGSRGHGGFVGLLLGSVSARCAEHAKCPVLVVHGEEHP